MAPALDQLLTKINARLSAQSAPLRDTDPHLKAFGRIGQELGELLRKQNGFYAYNSALLVRPFDREKAPRGVIQWNSPSLWKDTYEQLFDNVLFFAEDLFGGQFCIREGAVSAFDPELGEYRQVSDTLEGWAREILDNPEVRTGYPLVPEWERLHGPLKEGFRLVPKLPFFAGGKYEINNLYAYQDTRGMRFRGSLATQARDLPPGAPLVFRVGPKPPPPDSN
jgi:hypothetical protein